MKGKKFIFVLLVVIVMALLASCVNEASVASRNISTAADNFLIERRIIFYNAITDTYMQTIEGRCSITVDGLDNQLEVTCRVSETEYLKHYLGLSDNTTYFVEQTGLSAPNIYHYRVVFKPSTIIPDIEVK